MVTIVSEGAVFLISYPENGSSRFLLNVVKYLTGCITLSQKTATLNIQSRETRVLNGPN
jgi:hypothetical protein